MHYLAQRVPLGSVGHEDLVMSDLSIVDILSNQCSGLAAYPLCATNQNDPMQLSRSRDIFYLQVCVQGVWVVKNEPTL